MKLKKVLFVAIALLFFANPCFAYIVTFGLNQGVSYQDEGTLIHNDTTKLKDLDNDWGPTSPTGTVSNSYYATGTSPSWFDGISANFDLSGVGYSNILSATLNAYIKTGSYSNSWHHYNLYSGDKNTTDQDSGPNPSLGHHSFDHSGYSNGDWISHDVPLAWIGSDNLHLSLRLWNASVDQVTLVANVIPEPASLALLGIGLLGAFGAAGFRRKR